MRPPHGLFCSTDLDFPQLQKNSARVAVATLPGPLITPTRDAVRSPSARGALAGACSVLFPFSRPEPPPRWGFHSLRASHGVFEVVLRLHKGYHATRKGPEPVPPFYNRR